MLILVDHIILSYFTQHFLLHVFFSFRQELKYFMFCYSWPSKYFIDIQSQIAFSDTAVGKELQLRTRVGDTLLANIVMSITYLWQEHKPQYYYTYYLELTWYYEITVLLIIHLFHLQRNLTCCYFWYFDLHLFKAD